jgi:hypothetical protein
MRSLTEAAATTIHGNTCLEFFIVGILGVKGLSYAFKSRKSIFSNFCKYRQLSIIQSNREEEGHIPQNHG